MPVEDESTRSGKSFMKDESHQGSDAEKDTSREYQAKDSFRTDIGKGTWLAAGYHLATTIATPAAYAYLPFAFAGLGWAPGMIALMMGIVVTWYASILLASLHEHNGVRYFRYSDIATSIHGPWAGRAVITFQQIASLGNNITLAIVAGIAMKALNQSFSPGSTITLQQFIIIFGCIQLVFSQMPSIHDLRALNMICTICTCGFAISATALSIYSGKNPAPGSPPVDYAVTGSPTLKAFGVFMGLGTIAFGFGDTVLPEVQATLKAPVKQNMYKGIALCYSVISIGYLLVTISGYWAFGNTVTMYLPASFVGPVWAVRMCEFFALIQIVGCYQIYCRPTYEAVELVTMDTKQGPMAPRNIVTRLFITTSYTALLTLIACAMPFFGSFLALCGAIGFTPLDFIMPLILFDKVHENTIGLTRRVVHMCLVVLYTLVGIVAAMGALYFIVRDAQTFSFFADL